MSSNFMHPNEVKTTYSNGYMSVSFDNWTEYYVDLPLTNGTTVPRRILYLNWAQDLDWNYVKELVAAALADGRIKDIEVKTWPVEHIVDTVSDGDVTLIN